MEVNFESILFATSYFMSTVACQFSLFVIRKYHQNKPLGMQSLLGEVTVILTKVMALANIMKNATFVLTGLFAPFPRSGEKNTNFDIQSCALVILWKSPQSITK